MIKIFTVEEMVAAEQASDASGNTYSIMMESAGKSVAEAIIQRFPVIDRQVTVLVGPGNNGGDGLVAGRYLSLSGAEVTFYLYKPGDPETDSNLAKVQEMGLPVITSTDDQRFRVLRTRMLVTDILIDALLGTGVSRAIGGDLAKLFRQVRAALDERRRLYEEGSRTAMVPITGRRPGDFPGLKGTGHGSESMKAGPSKSPVIVAVDCPSGLNCNSGSLDPLALKANLTVTFAGAKRGHFLFPGAGSCGELVVADIGIKEDMPEVDEVKVSVATTRWMRELLPERRRDGHKGSFGWVLIAAGSDRYWGAAALAGRAAYRVGAGLVALAVPSTIRPTMATLLPEATYPTVEETAVLGDLAGKKLLAEVAPYEAMLIGPGLSRATSFIDTLLDERDTILPPLVIDADGLNLLAEHTNWHTKLPDETILTPHIGELARLMGISLEEIRSRERIQLAQEMSARWGCILLLKGAYTVIAAPDGHCTVLPFANPALATAGSGDVLSGIIVGLLGQGLAPFEAASLGGFLHGLAAEMGNVEAGLLASEIAEWVPEAIDALKGTNISQ